MALSTAELYAQIVGSTDPNRQKTALEEQLAEQLTSPQVTPVPALPMAPTAPLVNPVPALPPGTTPPPTTPPPTTPPPVEPTPVPAATTAPAPAPTAPKPAPAPLPVPTATTAPAPALAIPPPDTTMEPYGGSQIGPELQAILAQMLSGQGPTSTAQLNLPVDAEADSLARAAARGESAPQISTDFQFDPAFLQVLRSRMAGEGTPSFDQIMQAQYEPVAAELDRIFSTTKTQAFEDFVSRGILSSGETAKEIEDLSVRLGVSKAQVVGNLAVEYARERNSQINQAIQQFGILEQGRAQMFATISTANLAAAVQIQSKGLETLDNLNRALIQAQTTFQTAQLGELGANIRTGIESLTAIERQQMEAQLRDLLSRREITSQEKQTIMALQTQLQLGTLDSQTRLQLGQLASQTDLQLGALDASTRTSVASLQAETSKTVAQIGAQAALQAAGFDFQIAQQQISSRMTLEGVDWMRYQSDPEYAASVTQYFALRQDILLAIEQANSANQTLSGVEPKYA